MSPSEGSPEAQRRVLDAIRDPWREYPAEVAEFGRVALDDRIKQVASGWTVPVITRVQTGSASRLIHILNSLQESIETKSNHWITLYLDPFADTTKNGDN